MGMRIDTKMYTRTYIYMHIQIHAHHINVSADFHVCACTGLNVVAGLIMPLFALTSQRSRKASTQQPTSKVDRPA